MASNAMKVALTAFNALKVAFRGFGHLRVSGEVGVAKWVITVQNVRSRVTR